VFTLEEVAPSISCEGEEANNRRDKTALSPGARKKEKRARDALSLSASATAQPRWPTIMAAARVACVTRMRRLMDASNFPLSGRSRIGLLARVHLGPLVLRRRGASLSVHSAFTARDFFSYQKNVADTI